MSTIGKKTTVSICLYGNTAYGFYCLASVNDGTQKLGTMYGTCPEKGGPKYPTRSIAIWRIVTEMTRAGVNENAPTLIHADVEGRGPMVASYDMAMKPLTTCGMLTWRTEEVQNAAEKDLP